MTITLEAITKQFADGTQVLQGVDLVLTPDRITALVGISGSGKTTLLNIIAGLIAPSSGRILFEGRDVTPLAAQERNIGYVFQNYALFPHLDVLDNVAFSLRVRGVRQRERHDRARQMLDRVQIGGLAHRSIAQLSGGQKQRVALARALVSDPQMLLLDEPLSALDPVLRDTIRNDLRAVLEKLQITTVIVTHDKADAFVLADRMVMLSEGRILQDGMPRDLYDQPQSMEVAQFFGAMNLIEQVPGAEGMFAARLVRPEDFAVVPSQAEADLSITIQRCLYLGDRLRVIGVAQTGQTVTVDTAKTARLAPGTILHLAMPGPARAAREFDGAAQ